MSLIEYDDLYEDSCNTIFSKSYAILIIMFSVAGNGAMHQFRILCTEVIEI